MDTSFAQALEFAARAFEKPRRPWHHPGQLAQHLDPRILQTDALSLIDQELVDLYERPDGRLILSCPPQIGKSQRCSRWFPLWVLTQAPDTRIGIISYEHHVARRWGRAIRDDIISHPELGLRISDDLAAQHEWQLDGHTGGVYTAGIGAALTGRPLDLLIIDDPLKDREQADSKVYQDRVMDWWTDVGSTRLGPGAPVVQVATRWHERDLAGQLLASEDGPSWRIVNIPAQCEDPATDPLGRSLGEYMTSTRRNRQGQPLTTSQWDAVKRRAGSRTWAALYQGHPSPQAGGIFQRDWWRHWHHPPTRLDHVIQSWDMAFKGTDRTDFVVGQVWAKIDADYYLLDQVRGRWNFPETIAQVRLLSDRWPMAIGKLVEDKANGPAVIDTLRTELPGLIPVEPRGGKTVRAEAVSPLPEAGNVYLPPATTPWVQAFVDELASFPNGSHDDQTDAATQALAHLAITPTGPATYGTGFYDIG